MAPIGTKLIKIRGLKYLKLQSFAIFLIVSLAMRFLIFALFSPRLTEGEKLKLSFCLDQEPRITFRGQILTRQIGFQKLKIYLPDQPQLHWGDCFTIIGKIETCSSPSREKYCLLTEQISFLSALKNGSKLTRATIERIRLFREKLINFYFRYLPSPAAELLAGIVLGQKEIFSAQFYQQLRRTGTLHIVVASGYNLSMIGEKPALILAYLLGIKPALIVGLFLIWFYVVLVGFQPPIVRAGIMVSLLLLARLFERRFDFWRAFFLTLWLMLLIKPTLISRISFQLTVAALLGVSLAPKLFPGLVGRPLGQELAETISAQILVAPIIAWHFGRLSWLAPIVNVLVLPLVPWLMGFGLIALLVPIGFFQAILLQFLSYPFLFWIIRVIEFFGRWPGLELKLILSWWQLVLVYFILLIVIHKKLRKPHPETAKK